MPRVKLDPNYWKYILYDELRQHRQADIADAIGKSQQTVSRKMQNMSFTMPEMVEIARATGISLERVVRSI